MHWRLTPWLTEPAIEFLAGYLDKNKRVLEFGAGGSTIWMTPRCDGLITIEHDQGWLDRVAGYIQSQYNWNPIRHDLPYDGLCDDFPEDFFDLILIDGRERVACARAAIRTVKPGGVLMLDNAERERYAEVGDVLCKNWNGVVAIQRQPDAEDFMYDDWTTAWWYKPHGVTE